MTGAFIQSRRTPDGPLVTYHRPGEAALAFPDPGLDRDSAPTARTLALTLIGSLISPHLPTHVVDSFVERFLTHAPRDGWVIRLDEVERWKEGHADWVERMSVAARGRGAEPAEHAARVGLGELRCESANLSDRPAPLTID